MYSKYVNMSLINQALQLQYPREYFFPESHFFLCFWQKESLCLAVFEEEEISSFELSFLSTRLKIRFHKTSQVTGLLVSL